MFSFRKKKSWLRFYSLDPNVAELYPIEPAGKAERDFNDVGTRRVRPESGNQLSKNCPGIKPLMKSGYIMRAPADFTIATGPNVDGGIGWEVPFQFVKPSTGNYNIKGWEYYINWHAPWQTEPLIPHDTDNTNKPYLNSAVKVETPWRVKASEDMLLLQMPVSYNNETRFTAAYGIVDPMYMHAIPIQLFWHVLEGKTLVKAGTPLAQFVPISRSMLHDHEIIIDEAGDLEKDIEDAFTYANHHKFANTDNVVAKVKRIKQLFDRFRKKHPNAKI